MNVKSSVKIIGTVIICSLISAAPLFSQGLSGKFKMGNNKKMTFHPVETIYLPDTVISYNTSYPSKKEIYLYDQETIKTDRVQTMVAGIWTNFTLTTNTLNPNLNILHSLLQKWQNNTWVDSSKSEYDYDLNGYLSTILVQNMKNGNWEKSDSDIYVHDASGNVLSEKYLHWDGTTWVNGYFFIYTYDSSGFIINTLVEVGGSGGTWVNAGQAIQTYDASGNYLTDLNQEWNGTSWDNNLLETWTWDSNHHNLTYLRQNWFNNAWENTSSDTNTFDGNGNMVTKLELSWANNTWYNLYLSTYTYDGSGNCLTFLDQEWNSGAWVNFTNQEFSYQSKLIYGDAFNWDGTSWVPGEWWMNLELNNNGDPQSLFTGTVYAADVYYSSYINGISNQDHLKGESFSVFPNPANSVLTVKANFTIPGNVSCRVSDLSGRLVLIMTREKLEQGQTITLLTGNIPAGDYFIEIKAGNTTEMKKVTVVR